MDLVILTAQAEVQRSCWESLRALVRLLETSTMPVSERLFFPPEPKRIASNTAAGTIHSFIRSFMHIPFVRYFVLSSLAPSFTPSFDDPFARS